MKALKKIKETMQLDGLRPRFRDRRAHYASDAKTCVRDQYWALTGEKQTNKSDFIGLLKMMIGTAVEEQLIGEVIKRAHHVGLHHIASQVPVGFSTPVKVDGSLDSFVYEDNINEPYVIEIKTKNGWGAGELLRTCDPGEGYMAQMGLYLRDLATKGITNRGCFIFILLSDDTYGEMVQINCKYEAGAVTAYSAELGSGETRLLSLVMTDAEMTANYVAAEKALKEKKEPRPSYQYKRPLTPEFLATQSDYALKAAIEGNKILGDWQPRYSKFFQKQLETDNQVREYTNEEIQLLKNEYNSRLTPTGRKRKAI